MSYESEELNEETRKTLPGDFIQLSNGFTNYELAGREDGDVVVLVHGFSSPQFIWDPTFSFLVNEGFRVLRYDLYGRGYSDRPNVLYTMDFFVNQLHELVEKLKLTTDKFNIIGLSMGGGISVVLADKYPNLIRKVSLIDPIGFPMGRNILLSIMKIPVLNQLILNLYLSHKRIIESQKEDFFQSDKIDEYLAKFTAQTKYKGFLKAIKSTALNTSFTSLKDTYTRLGKLGIPMQLFWGKEDQTIPFSTSKKVCKAVPSIEFHPIEESGHVPHYTHPEIVNPLLLDFLRQD